MRVTECSKCPVLLLLCGVGGVFGVAYDLFVFHLHDVLAELVFVVVALGDVFGSVE